MWKYRIDISGQRFGRLVAISYVKPSKWLCKCDCGNEVIVKLSKLKSDNTVSCKCYRNIRQVAEKRLGSGTANMRELLRTYKKSAKQRGHSFELAEDDFKILTKNNCFYCGSEPKQIKNNKQCYGTYIYNGIDRINSDIGYTLENCVTCCKWCNFAKNTMTQEEFKTLVTKIYNNWVKTWTT